MGVGATGQVSLRPDRRETGRSRNDALWLFAGHGVRARRGGTGLAALPALMAQARTFAEAASRVATGPYPAFDQPAMLAAAVATVAACRRQGGTPGGVLGHSFGEYPALVAAGAWSFRDAVRVAVARGQAMADAADGTGGMLAVIGLAEAAVREVCEARASDPRLLTVAAHNSPTQTVLTGERRLLSEVAGECRRRGARRTRLLPVPFAAHSPAMAGVRERVAEVVTRVRLHRPAVPYYSTVTGAPVDDPDELRRLLVRAVTEPVRFRQAVTRALADGYRRVLEVGTDSPPALLGLLAETCRVDLPALPMPRLAAVAADADAPAGRPYHPGIPRHTEPHQTRSHLE
ncbi:ACP S-malonyltransferase [Micromonospora sp. FIMYZ51]|uniref:ACP S-malonyltransferase n=1 Tax=Micromonospora sp. FIMYZ51 TaxID=3051832 RepID=UPI00311F5D6B